MKKFIYNRKEYEIDDQNFLIDYYSWDNNFALGMAVELAMTRGLTARHWEVIHIIRNRFYETGTCPVIYEIKWMTDLDVQSLQQLFPTGYFRGACLLAGISYRYGWVYYFGEPYHVPQKKSFMSVNDYVELKFNTELPYAIVFPSP